jgi:hypothetical protein
MLNVIVLSFVLQSDATMLGAATTLSAAMVSFVLLSGVVLSVMSLSVFW